MIMVFFCLASNKRECLVDFFCQILDKRNYINASYFDTCCYMLYKVLAVTKGNFFVIIGI